MPEMKQYNLKQTISAKSQFHKTTLPVNNHFIKLTKVLFLTKEVS
jgi:hypothetical protein